MINKEEPIVTILCSGVALGVYIPALLINYQLRQQQLNTEVIVLENYYTLEAQEKLKEYKKAYHNNFSLALIAHRMSKNIQVSFNQNQVNNLLKNWQSENRLYFIIWSGFWIPIIEQYRKQVRPKKLTIDICRIDAEISASFKTYKERNQDDHEVWLWHWEKKRLVHEIPVTNEPPIPYSKRVERFVIHGGGWGIGTYQSKISELHERGLLLDIVAYETKEIVPQKIGSRYFMVDPNWFPWIKNSKNQHDFPPFGEATNLTKIDFKSKEEYHEFYDVVRQSKAIVSKPGGGTLIDSLASATPIILLEPYGYAEQKNAELWEYLGYGISYNKWKELDYDYKILELLHQNILTRPSLTINYPQKYASNFRKK